MRVGYQQRENRLRAGSESDRVRGRRARCCGSRTDGESRYREGQITARYQFHGTDQIVGVVHPIVGDRQSERLQQLLRKHREPGHQTRRAGTAARGTRRTGICSGATSACRTASRCSRSSTCEPDSRCPWSTKTGISSARGTRRAAIRRSCRSTCRSASGFASFHHNATVGLKVFNITNHFNPRDYQGNLASADFGGFAQQRRPDVPRQVGVRILTVSCEPNQPRPDRRRIRLDGRGVRVRVFQPTRHRGRNGDADGG